MKHIKGINGMRAFAVSLVIIQHYIVSYMYRTQSSIGDLGVTVFFVISGFLITSILVREKQDLSRTTTDKMIRFYARRAVRIFPIYYAVVAIGVLSGAYWFSEISKWWNVLYATNIYMVVNEHNAGYTSHFWSLDVEEQFYMIWPLLIFMTPQKHLVKLFVFSIMVSFVSIAIRPFFGHGGVFLPALPFYHLDSLGAGALLAVLSGKELFNKYFEVKSYMLLIGVVMTLGTCMIRDTHLSAYGLEAAGLVMNISGVITSCMTIQYIIQNQSSTLVSILENRIIAGFGAISYGFYLIHNMAPEFFTETRFSPRLPQTWTSLAVYFFTSLVLATLSWHFFEKPILKNKNRLEGFLRKIFYQPSRVKS